MPLKNTPTPSEETTEIPYGYCQCGCGEKTNIIKASCKSKGKIRGEPSRYLPGHHTRMSGPGPNPSGLCMCGCGQKTPPARQSVRKTGLIIGKPCRVVPGHRPKRRATKYEHVEGAVRFHVGKDNWAIVDEEDWPLISRFTWTASPRAVTAKISTGGGKQEVIFLHRLILDPPPGKIVDHHSGDILDNRRSNLRIASPWQNSLNRTVRPNSSSGYLGVQVERGRWRAAIGGQSNRRYLGTFGDRESAARVYDQAARELYGEFACLNFPNPGERSAITGEIVPIETDSAA